jgi:hypothetical protein
MSVREIFSLVSKIVGARVGVPKVWQATKLTSADTDDLPLRLARLTFSRESIALMW